MRRAKMLMVAAALALLLAPAGCQKPSPTDVQSITSGVVQLGFSVWAGKNPTQAAAVAAQVSQGCDTALDYLRNNSGAATTVLDAVMQAKLTDNLPPEIQDMIVAAAGILDTVLPAPGPDTILTQAQLAYAVGFVQGVKNGIAASGTKALIKDMAKVQKYQKSLKPGKWLTHKQPVPPAPAADKAAPAKK